MEVQTANNVEKHVVYWNVDFTLHPDKQNNPALIAIFFYFVWFGSGSTMGQQIAQLHPLKCGKISGCIYVRVDLYMCIHTFACVYIYIICTEKYSNKLP